MKSEFENALDEIESGRNKLFSAIEQIKQSENLTIEIIEEIKARESEFQSKLNLLLEKAQK